MIPARTLSLFLLLASGTVLAIAARLSPDPRGFGTHESLGLPPCGFLATNGYPCMTCGMTTAFANMIRLDVAAAWRANPMGIALFLLTVAAALFAARCLKDGTDPLRPLRHPKAPHAVIGMSIALLGNWFLMIRGG